MPSDELIDMLAEEIAVSLVAIREEKMRTHALVKKVEGHRPEVIAELFNRIIRRANASDPKFQCALSGLIDISTVAEKLGNPTMSDIYAYASENGLSELVNILIRPPASKKYDIIENISEDETPLGVKITMSKTNNRIVLERFLYDGNPRLIQTLLRNPRLLESDVLKIATQRPVNEQILWAVYENKKWIARYTVKLALILNPYCPPEIGLKLLPFILEPDLHRVMEEKNIHPAIHDATRRKIEAVQPGADYLDTD